MSYRGSEKHREYLRQWRAANKDKVSAANKRQYYKDVEASRFRVRQWERDNPEKVEAKNRARKPDTSEASKIRKSLWAIANRERVREQRRVRAITTAPLRQLARAQAKAAKAAEAAARREANKEQERERKRAWKLANPEKVKVAARAYHAKNRRKRLEANKRRYHAKKALMAAQSALWKKVNAHKVREYSMRRNAIKKATAVAVIDYDEIFRESGGVCGICDKPLDLFGYHFDHIIPLAKGGTHTHGNIQVAHAHCNIAKGARVAA